MGSFVRALFDALVSAGVPADRAERVVELFERGVDERYSLHAQVLATRRDLAELEARLVREIAETGTRIAECNARIAESKSDLARWMLAALTAQTALLLGAIKLF